MKRKWKTIQPYSAFGPFGQAQRMASDYLGIESMPAVQHFSRTLLSFEQYQMLRISENADPNN